MKLETCLILSISLWALVISVGPVQSASAVETNAEPPMERNKRQSFFPWSMASRRSSLSLYEASNTFPAAPYTISRPYYIPVYGAPGRPLLFYPPQPVYLNPGMPQDNPPVYGGPGYLPPKETPHMVGGASKPPKESSTTKMPNPAPDRIPDDLDDGPIWGDGDMVQMPLSGDQDRQQGVRPTRAPMGRATSPPLVHNGQSSAQGSGFADQSINPPFAQNDATSRPTQPPPSAQRPAIRPTTVSPPEVSSGPSNCVWAIISCCSAANPKAWSQNCFEQKGCPGPFWGTSPCATEYARAAIAAANDYYSNSRSSFGK